jgi:penicillin amidase
MNTGTITIETIRKVAEEIKLKGKSSVMDTVRTPIMSIVYSQTNLRLMPDTCRSCMRWVAHESENELLTFYKLNRANNYQQYVQPYLIMQHLHKIFYADMHNDIAIWSNGRLPIKWKEQGKYY